MKRLFFVLLCMLMTPAAASLDAAKTTATPFVAYAGHALNGGGYCDCGCAGCICETGETPNCPRTNSVVNAPRKGDVPTHGEKGGLDFFGGALVLALAAWIFIRLRA